MALPEIQMPPEFGDYKADSYELVPDSLYADVPRQSGTTRRRRVFTSAPQAASVQLELSQAQIEIFFAWHENALVAGERPFAARVANMGTGFKWFSAYVVQWSVDHQEGSEQLLSLKLRLEGPAFTTGPVSAILSAEVSVPVDAGFNQGYPFALSAEVFNFLEMDVETGALFRAEVRAPLESEISGPQVGGISLICEIEVECDVFFIVEPPSLFAAEVFSTVEVEFLQSGNIAAEVTVPVDISVIGSASISFIAHPADLVLIAYKPGGSFTQGTVFVFGDGRVAKQANTGPYAYPIDYYSPTTANIGNNLWIRMSAVSGALTSGITNTWMQIGNSRAWQVVANSTGLFEFQGQIQIAQDPDGVNIVSTFDVYISVEYAT